MFLTIKAAKNESLGDNRHLSKLACGIEVFLFLFHIYVNVFFMFAQIKLLLYFRKS